ncbi:MAG: hypothetical protein CMK07_09035, partial [Ponticaulis sp.]|nr:hypothetical protein [Ponticaulis sp.]
MKSTRIIISSRKLIAKHLSLKQCLRPHTVMTMTSPMLMMTMKTATRSRPHPLNAVIKFRK